VVQPAVTRGANFYFVANIEGLKQNKKIMVKCLLMPIGSPVNESLRLDSRKELLRRFLIIDFIIFIA
jgi:hypothetical protein